MLENLRVYIFGILGCIYLLYIIIILLICLYVLFIDNFWVKYWYVFVLIFFYKYMLWLICFNCWNCIEVYRNFLIFFFCKYVLIEEISLWIEMLDKDVVWFFLCCFEGIVIVYS